MGGRRAKARSSRKLQGRGKHSQSATRNLRQALVCHEANACDAGRKKMRCVLTIEHTLSLPRDHPLEITHFDSVFALNIFSSTQLIFRNQVCVSYMRCDRPCSKHVVFKRRLQRVFHLLMSTAPKTWKPPPLQRSGSIICLYAGEPFFDTVRISRYQK